ncbi:MAG: UDP-N-acetylmuramoyl-tripeptide--D-alanyl-D-alanine ligase [Candidatus Paracaedibacteraceae bacterium]|nr:UDP-N-acetylmuramoyl-tripeptide--D-alanyl-D-alanine ligase [Candidatus Paracaedibacteraceae bacterium]
MTQAKAPWGLNELISALGLPTLSVDAPVYGISIDTRTLKPGDLYIPMEGQRDGHAFVADAFEKGAIAAFVTSSFDIFSVKGRCIVVPDTLIALQQLGIYNRKKSSAKIIAVTGSVGKTTLKEMLGHILHSFGKTVISKASYNNCWGVPLSLLDLRSDTEFGVLEVGMNHPGEIEPLAHMIVPDIAIITKLAEAHIGHMGSFEAIAHEKSTLLNALKPDGTALIYGGSSSDHILLQNIKGHTYKLCDMSNLKAYVHHGKTRVSAIVDNRTLHYILPFAALHHVGNSILAVEACHAMQLDVQQAATMLETFELPAGRGVTRNIVLSNNISITLIDDSYNANPVSMRAGLLSLKDYNADRRIAVLGEMRELGAESSKYHSDLFASLEEANIDLLFCCGEEMSFLYNIIPENLKGFHANRAVDLITPLITSLRSGDVIFVKGSNGSKVSEVVNFLLNPQ